MNAEGVFSARSVARRIDRELFVLLGGTAALLMQVAHPLVAAGVADHSRFTSDPIGRLRRTLNTTLDVVFGDEVTARRAIRRIDGRHRTIEGHAADGTPYRARDPRLLLWVQATLVLTSLRLYEVVAGPLAPDDRDSYWSETKPVAIALGIPGELLPATIDDLFRYERAALETDVMPSATSMRLGRAVLRPIGFVPSLVHWPFDAITAALLPAALRASFGMRWRTRDRLVARAMLIGLRLIRHLTPASLRFVPHARRAS